MPDGDPAGAGRNPGTKEEGAVEAHRGSLCWVGIISVQYSKIFYVIGF